MSSWFDSLPKDLRDKAEKRAMPSWKPAMLATLVHDYFSDPDWIYERKLDGERCLIHRKKGKITLYSRNEKKLNDSYPEIVEALEKADAPDFIADGEIVAFDGAVTSFSRLQQRIGLSDRERIEKTRVAVYLYLFDLMWADGYDLAPAANRARKAALKRLMSFEDPIRYLAHRNEDGEAYHREACRKGWEGIIAKDATAAYVEGRSKKWQKFKCANEQEFVIGGFTDPKGERKGFGALLVGVYDGDDLVYAGKIGTGFDDALLEDLHERMKKIERQTPAFADPPKADAKIHWVSPKLVCEVGFTEWTRDGRLRHPRFLGLRRDKDPKDVVREDKS